MKITHERGWWYLSFLEKLKTLKPHKFKIIDAWSWGPFLMEKRDG